MNNSASIVAFGNKVAIEAHSIHHNFQVQLTPCPNKRVVLICGYLFLPSMRIICGQLCEQ
jgi:hypothetical protein